MAEDDLTKFTDVMPAKGEPSTQGMPAEEDVGPMYQVVGDTKIIVSKKRGALWKARRDERTAAVSKLKRAWTEAIRYYHNDQTRDTDSNDATSVSAQGGVNMRETENIVFANISALVPMLYTKNPDAEFTAQSEQTKPLSETLEKLMKKLAAQKSTPGLNLKRAVKRCIVMTTLTNCSWLEVGYTLREQSSEAALEELRVLSEALEKAASQEEIKEVEGKLMALESTIDMLQPSGPWRKVRKPWEVLFDAASPDLGLTDANWIMIEDMMPTMLLRARYGKKQPDSKEWQSLYEPTHVLKGGTQSGADENITGDNFVLFSKEGSGAKDYGYDDDNAFKCAQMTKVYYVWDKVTRRCELYSDASWKWPVWVWDDPYHLDNFFPITALEFHTDPLRAYAKGEVTYYLDHQDALNVMNNEFSRIRGFASSMVAYNKNLIKDPTELEAVLGGTYDKKAVGFDVPEGEDIRKLFAPLLPPSAEVAKFYDKAQTLASIDRVSGVTSVQRGVEYKTNTTNRAIESYESQMQTRADEKMDAIEEFVGDTLWMVAQMCLQFMTAEEVDVLIGTSEGWEQLDPKKIPLMFTPRVIGGSTLKPTSRAKKEQALQISQIVGQFAKATPAAAIVALKVLSEAFGNEMVISDADWDFIMQGIQQQMQAQAAQTQGPQGEQQQPQGGQGGQPKEPGVRQQAGDEAVGDIVQKTIMEAGALLDSLPPEMKTQIGVMLARQQPVQQIMAAILSQLDQGNGAAQ